MKHRSTGHGSTTAMTRPPWPVNRRTATISAATIALLFCAASSAKAHRVVVKASPNSKVTVESKELERSLSCSSRRAEGTCAFTLPSGSYTFKATKGRNKTTSYFPAQTTVAISSSTTIDLSPTPYVKQCWKIDPKAEFEKGHITDTNNNKFEVTPTEPDRVCATIRNREQVKGQVTLSFKKKRTYAADLQLSPKVIDISGVLEDPEVRVKLTGYDGHTKIEAHENGYRVSAKLTHPPNDHHTLTLHLPYSTDPHNIELRSEKYLTKSLQLYTNGAPDKQAEHTIRLRLPRLIVQGPPASDIVEIVDTESNSAYKPTAITLNDGSTAFEFKDLPKGRRTLQLNVQGWKLDKHLRTQTVDLEQDTTHLIIKGERPRIEVEAPPDTDWIIFHDSRAVSSGSGQGAYSITTAGNYTFAAQRRWHTEYKTSANLHNEDITIKPTFHPTKKEIQAGDGCAHGLVYLKKKSSTGENSERFLFSLAPNQKQEIKQNFYTSSSDQVFELNLRCRDASASQTWSPEPFRDELILLQAKVRPANERPLAALTRDNLHELKPPLWSYGRIIRPTSRQTRVDSCDRVHLPSSFSHKVITGDSSPQLSILSPKNLLMLIEHPDGSNTCVKTVGHRIKTITLPHAPGEHQIAVTAQTPDDQPGYVIWTERGDPEKLPKVRATEFPNLTELTRVSGQFQGRLLQPGDAANAENVNDCVGWGEERPIGKVTLSKNGQLYIEASAKNSSSSHDLVLTILRPDGRVECYDDDDDTKTYNVHAHLRHGPHHPEGTYIVWVGRNKPGKDSGTEYELHVVRTEGSQRP